MTKRSQLIIMLAILPICFVSYVQGADSQCDSLIYAVHDGDMNNTQFLTVNPLAGFKVAPLGPEYPGKNIEGLDIHPLTGELFGVSGGDESEAAGHLYRINKSDGGLSDLGPIRFDYEGTVLSGRGISSLSFHPDGSLWGWTNECGLLQINEQTAAAELKLQFTSPEVCRSGKLPKDAIQVEDLTWDNQGKVIYAAAGNEVWAYTYQTGELKQIARLSSARHIETLKMLPEGLLLVGVHGSGDQDVEATTLKVLNPETGKVETDFSVKTSPYYDVEGIAWPASCSLAKALLASLPPTDKELTQHTRKLLADSSLTGEYPIIYSLTQDIPANQLEIELAKVGLSPVWVQAKYAGLTLATSISLGMNIQDAVSNYLQSLAEIIPQEDWQKVMAESSVPLIQAVVAFGDVKAHRQIVDSGEVYGAMFVLPGYDPRNLVMFSPISQQSTTLQRQATRGNESFSDCSDKKIGKWPWLWPEKGSIMVTGPKGKGFSDEEAYVYASFSFPDVSKWAGKVVPCDPSKTEDKVQFGMEFSVNFSDGNGPDFGGRPKDKVQQVYTELTPTDLDKIIRPPPPEVSKGPAELYKTVEGSYQKEYSTWVTNLPGGVYLDRECVEGGELDGSYDQKCDPVLGFVRINEQDASFNIAVGVLEASKLKQGTPYWFLVAIEDAAYNLKIADWPIRAQFDAEVTRVDWPSDFKKSDISIGPITTEFLPETVSKFCDPGYEPRYITSDGAKLGSLYCKNTYHLFQPRSQWAMSSFVGVPTPQYFATGTGVTTGIPYPISFFTPSWDELTGYALGYGKDDFGKTARVPGEMARVHFARVFGNAAMSCQKSQTQEELRLAVCVSDAQVPKEYVQQAEMQVYTRKLNGYDNVEFSKAEILPTGKSCYIKGQSFQKGEVRIVRFTPSSSSFSKEESLVGVLYGKSPYYIGHDLVPVKDGTVQEAQCDNRGCVRLEDETYNDNKGCDFSKNLWENSCDFKDDGERPKEVTIYPETLCKAGIIVGSLYEGERYFRYNDPATLTETLKVLLLANEVPVAKDGGYQVYLDSACQKSLLQGLICTEPAVKKAKKDETVLRGDAMLYVAKLFFLDDYRKYLKSLDTGESGESQETAATFLQGQGVIKNADPTDPKGARFKDNLTRFELAVLAIKAAEATSKGWVK